jgi:hypothetical protein
MVGGRWLFACCREYWSIKNAHGMDGAFHGVWLHSDLGMKQDGRKFGLDSL